MDTSGIQQQLFQTIKRKLPPDASAADEIAGLLDISSDSAYRRMRGEKPITIDELQILAAHFQISLDQLMNIQTGAILFQGNLLNPLSYRYHEYLTGMINNLTYFKSFKQNEYIYLCKETPIFHYFNIPELAAFKYFFWMGTLIYFPEFRNKKVNFDEYPDDLLESGEKVIRLYTEMDSVEIWNMESWNTTLHQIEYYIDNNMFMNDTDALRVYDASEKVLNHLEEQARLGYKFHINDPEKKPCGKYSMYFNEIVIMDNSMMALLDNTKMSILPHTAINYMLTRDMRFSENHYQYIQNLIKRSTLISEVSEKERARYFRRMRERIEKRRDLLKV